MKRTYALIPAFALLVFGALYYYSELKDRRELRAWPISLRQYLGHEAGVPTYPKARESDLHQIMRRFALTRPRAECVRSIRFIENDKAILELSEHECRGYPHISARRKSGVWALDWGRYK